MIVGRGAGTDMRKFLLFGLSGSLMAACLMTPGAVKAQEISLLDRAEQLADRGEVREARQALDRWQREFGDSASLGYIAQAWYLEARLIDDGNTAELLYLRVIIEGSSTQYADDALLRLGQYKYAEENYSKTIEYMGRLRRDYPTSEHGPEALLWIARAARATGDADRACAAADQGLQELAPTDTVLERSLSEERADCRATERTFTVQVAAFKDEVAAQNLARELLMGGYDAWVLNATSSDPLYRVRVGRGLIHTEAQSLLERLTRAGYAPFLVSHSGARN